MRRSAPPARAAGGPAAAAARAAGRRVITCWSTSRVLFALCLSSSAALGCFRRPDVAASGPVVESLEISGDAVDTERLEEGLATHETPSFLFMQGVVYDYEVLDEALLERDLERVERFYRARGHYEAKVTGARVIWTGADSVRIVIVVSEGPPVRIGGAGLGALAVELTGLGEVDARTAAAIIAESPQPGEVFDEEELERAKGAMLRLLLDSGYAHAKVTARADVNLALHEARTTFVIEAGRRAVLGPITIVGLQQIPEAGVRQSLLIARGDDYSASALEDARRALVNLGVFAAVDIQPDLSDPGRREVPVTFSVQETAPRTVRVGAGARLDALQLSGSLTGSWEHRNFLGGLRQLSIEARPGVVLFPTRMTDFPDLQAPNRVMLQGSLESRFTQPSFIEGRTRGLLSAAVELRPLLYTDTGLDEQLVGFVEVATRAGLERPFLSHRLFLTPALNWQAALPIDYRSLSLGERSPPVNEFDFSRLFIVYPEFLARYDLRDNPLDPRSGLLLSSSLQVAVPALGGNVSDVRIRPEARFYITKRRLTLALRATTGLLFPRDYAPSSGAGFARGDQVLLFRGFFSGGPFSNRGYAFQGVGPHGALPLVNEGGVRCIAPASPDAPDVPVDPRCLRPRGGLTLWEASVELRFPLAFLSPLGAVLFLDSSDVRPGRVDYGIGSPHLAPGFGLRYPTPVGPVRLDVGFRLLEALGREEPQGSPPELFGAPVTVHLAVGQAF